jgi:hypothetical protein
VDVGSLVVMNAEATELVEPRNVRSTTQRIGPVRSRASCDPQPARARCDAPRGLDIDATYPRSPSTQSGRCRSRPRPPCGGGIASTNATASVESCRLAPVNGRRAAHPARRKSDGACSRAWPGQWDSDRSGHRRTLRGRNNCPRPPATNQSGRGVRANPEAQSGSDPTRPPVASRAPDASTSSPTRTRVPAGAFAMGCRCGGQTECR